MCNELSVTASEHIYFGDSDQPDADPSLPHRKVRLGIFHIKRDTTGPDRRAEDATPGVQANSNRPATDPAGAAR